MRKAAELCGKPKENLDTCFVQSFTWMNTERQENPTHSLAVYKVLLSLLGSEM